MFGSWVNGTARFSKWCDAWPNPLETDLTKYINWIPKINRGLFHIYKIETKSLEHSKEGNKKSQ